MPNRIHSSPIDRAARPKKVTRQDGQTDGERYRRQEDSAATGSGKEEDGSPASGGDDSRKLGKNLDIVT